MKTEVLGRKRRRFAGMPTVLVDFAFVLVLLFMILIAVQPVVDLVDSDEIEKHGDEENESSHRLVNLPENSSEQASPASGGEQYVNLTITPDGLWWEEDMIDRDTLSLRLNQESPPGVLLRADASLPYGEVASLLLAIESARISEVSLVFRQGRDEGSR